MTSHGGDGEFWQRQWRQRRLKGGGRGGEQQRRMRTGGGRSDGVDFFGNSNGQKLFQAFRIHRLAAVMQGFFFQPRALTLSVP